MKEARRMCAQWGRRQLSRYSAQMKGLRSIFFLSFGSDPLTRRLRGRQLAALRDMLPVTNAVSLFNAILLAVAMRNVLSSLDLALWISGMGLLILMRIRSVLSKKHNSANPVTVYLLVLASAAMWSIPGLHWYDHGGPDERLLIMLVTVGMMCGGCVTLSSMPVACWTFVVLMGSVLTFLQIRIHEPILAIMTVGLTLLLCWTGLRYALQFFEHQRDRIDLEEKADLVKLMREFEASGSGWLWETDASLRVTYVSSDGTRRSVSRVRELLGREVKDVLDPEGRIAKVSEGTQALLRHFAERRPFRDIAVPSVAGRWWSLSGKPIYDDSGALVAWRGLGSDITEARVRGEDAIHAARRDPLTGLANRLLVREAIEEALLWAQDHRCSLLLVDLDRFKLVNDTLGHAVGDMLLREVARRLCDTIGREALVGRLGGDEFAVVLPGTEDRGLLAAMATRVIRALSNAYVIGGVELHIGATIGIATAPDDAASQEELTTSADLALYRAKEEGRGTYCFYHRWMSERARAHRQLESDLRGALQSGGLALAYQPIVEARDGQIVGYEALLRWTHPTLGDIPPDRFVPIIEDAGLMNQIGSWVIREACAEAASWAAPHRIAVNVSAAQVNGASLAATVLTALAETGLAADRLELEVTENVFLGDDEATLAGLSGLRALGVRLVIDDFGKGYSSFGYLARAHFSKIKIDQSFVRGAADGARESLAIVHGILALASGLEVETTAEGIETQTEAEVMRALGCTQLQGFLFGRPAMAVPRAGKRGPRVPLERRKAQAG